MNESSSSPVQGSAEIATTSLPAASPPELPAAPTDRERSRAKTRLRIVGATAALGGIAFGGAVEYFVGNLLDSTGWFGPTIENVIQEQVANFSAIQSKLTALERAASDADRERLTKELAALLGEQERLASRTHAELQQSQRQLESARDEALRAAGGSAGFSFRLGPGQSIIVGSRENVFAVQNYHSGGATVILNGESRFIRPGDFMEASVGSDLYRVLFRSLPTRDNPVGGFDVVKLGG